MLQGGLQSISKDGSNIQNGNLILSWVQTIDFRIIIKNSNVVRGYMLTYQEFKFIYDDLKSQTKQIPSLPLLLKSIEKTTKKLDCINLYSAIDKREFDFQLFEKEIFDEITDLVRQVNQLCRIKQTESVNMERMVEVEQKLDRIRDSKMDAFDQLNKMEQSLQNELDKLVDEQAIMNPPNIDNQIKQVQEDEEEMQQTQKTKENPTNRVQALKQEIDELNKKISKINRGKGKWFDGDHNDFVMIYNRCGGDAQRVIEEGMKILGMKNIEIVDHLQVYENYLQLQKEKRLVNEQFKSIRMLEQEIKNQEQIQHQLNKEKAQKQRKRLKQEEQLQKKLLIEQFKRKKEQEREKLIKQAERQKEVVKNVKRVSVQKKKEIQLRNKKLIQEKQEQFKTRNTNSLSKNDQKDIMIGANQIKPIPKSIKPPISKK